MAVTTGPGSFTGLRVGIAAARGIALAAGKPAIGLSTLAAFAAPLIAADDTLPVVVAIDARHEHVYLQVFGPGGRTLVAPRHSPITRSIARGDIRRAAHHRQCGQPAGSSFGRPANARRPRLSSAARPISTGWRGWARPQPTLERRRSRSTCARPTLSRRTPFNWPADDRLHQQPFRARRAGTFGGGRRATHRPSRRCTAHPSGAAGANRKSRASCSTAHVIAHRALPARTLAGFIMSRLAEDEAEILVGGGRRPPARPRPCAPPARSSSAPPGRTWLRAPSFWKSTNTMPGASALSARGFSRSLRAAPTTIPRRRQSRGGAGAAARS